MSVLKQIVQDEVIEPARSKLTLEQAIRFANVFNLLIDWMVAEQLNRLIHLPNLVNKNYGNIERLDYADHLWACKHVGIQSPYVYVKTLPKLKPSYGVIHSWTDVRGQYGKFRAPQMNLGRVIERNIRYAKICNRIMLRTDVESQNLERAKRRLKQIQILNAPERKPEDARLSTRAALYTKIPSRQDTEHQELHYAKCLSPKRMTENHPWFSLTPAARAFYRGFFDRNVETRREFLEQYGISNALDVMNAKLVDMDSTTHNGTRALYKLDIPKSDALVVSCSTTQRVYLIWVPKGTKSCLKADLFLSRGLRQGECVGAA